jgi:hypothetical protein
MKISIKNMVCSRCILVVKTELEKLGWETKEVGLGYAELTNDLSPEAKEELDRSLRSYGFKILSDKKSKTIERIKTLIIDLIQNHHFLVRICARFF